MPSNFSSLAVDWYDQSDAYVTTVDITADVKSIPLFTDTGTGEVNQCTIVIRSLDGAYNTTGSTIFANWDRIRLRVTDLASNSYDRYFEILNIIPSQSKGEGTLLTLECIGIEYHTQQLHISKPYYFEDSYTVALSVGDMYERSRGTEQPILSNYNIVYTEGNGFGNALPFYNANNWEFGINEDTCYNRWIDLIDGAGAAVSAGGALTFYELNFLTTGVNAMNFKLRASGDNSTIVQVVNSVATGVKVGEQEGMLSNPTGTNVMAWGSNEHGTLPVDNSKYDSGLLKFIFRPNWVTGVAYAVDSYVQIESTGTPHPKHYKCLIAHTSGTFATDLSAGKWVLTDMSIEFGDTIQYSPWTDGKAALLSNSGADPARVNFTNAGWFDINVVINESEFFRTWVDARVTTTNTNTDLDTLAARYAYSTARSTFPRGFRVLVTATGTLTGDLANFQDMVVERVPLNSTGTNTWRKLYTFDTGNNKVQIANLDDGKIYVDTVGGSAGSPTHTWSTSVAASYGNDCFHPYTTAPAQDVGIDLVFQPSGSDPGKYIPRSDIDDSTERPDISSDGGVFTQNQDSAIKLVALAPDILSSTASDFAGQSSGWYKTTIGWNIRFPFPTTNDNSISESVGQLYGGGTTGANKVGGSGNELWVTATAYKIGDIVYNSTSRYIALTNHTSGTFATDKAAGDWRLLVPGEPATLDIQNMNFTHDGQDGFNTINSASEDLGQISAIAFWLKFSIQAGGKELNDEHRFRAFAIDTKDNVVYQDFVVRFSNNWEDIRLPVGSFRIYKGRKPLYGWDAAIAAFVPPKELEIINIFEWRNIKIFGVQYQPQYDKYGRFNPAAAIVDESGNSVTWGNLAGATRTLWVDGFRFIKPLLVTSGPVTDRNLEPDFQQFPNITVYDQLLNTAKSHLEIEKFKHKEFNIESTGDKIFDIPFGDSFYLYNKDLVNDDDKAGEDNNIKLVAKRIEYSITKPPGGKGGLRRKINGSKIFT